MKYILTVGICSTPSSYSLSLWICVQRELSRSLVVDDSVLVPRNLTRILTPSASNHSGKSDVTFAITEVLPAPGSPHITTGALKFKCKLIYGFCERGGSPIVFTIDAFANHCQITLLVTKKNRNSWQGSDSWCYQRLAFKNSSYHFTLHHVIKRHHNHLLHTLRSCMHNIVKV